MNANSAQLLWEQRRYCDSLGVSALAANDEILKARRRLQLVHHSDKGANGDI